MPVRRFMLETSPLSKNSLSISPEPPYSSHCLSPRHETEVMQTTMDTAKINSKDFIDDHKSVVECAGLIADEATRLLKSGVNVVVSVRGVSSSFFNVILSAVAEVLQNDFRNGRFDVETETAAQQMVFQRSLAAFSPLKP